jgi:hypothetical protein
MKIKSISALLIISLLFLMLLAGCGGGGRTEDGKTEDVSSEPVEAVPDVVEQDISEQITEAANTEADEDEFIGDWVGTDDDSLFVKIAKDGDKYTYQDNDGSYEATMADGILKVTVAEGEFADVYVDKETGNLVLTYMDSIITYTKK